MVVDIFVKVKYRNKNEYKNKNNDKKYNKYDHQKNIYPV